MMAKSAIAALVFMTSTTHAYAGTYWDLSEPKEIVYEDANGILKFTYQTFVNQEFTIPKPFIKGKFEIEDKRP